MTEYLPTPSWHSEALCLSSAAPEDWDSTERGDGLKRWEQLVRAVEVCEGCPVAAQCAQAALDSRANGVVMGGVPLPDWVWWAGGRGSYLRAVERVAAGELPHLAVARELCCSPGYEPAARYLEDRAGVVVAGGSAS